MRMNDHEQNLEKIRKACIEANPDIMREYHFGWDGPPEVDERPIQLADVLMALKDKLMIDGYGKLFYDLGMNREHGLPEKDIHWNLKQPLSGQTPETILFLSQLLK